MERRNLELAFWALCSCQGGPKKPPGLRPVRISVVSMRSEPVDPVAYSVERLSYCLFFCGNEDVILSLELLTIVEVEKQ